MKKYVLGVLNPKTKKMHFGKPNTVKEVIKESKLFKNISFYTEKEYQEIVKGIL